MIVNLEEKVMSAKEACLEMCIGAGVGHVTSAFSCAEIVATLYYDIMNIDPKNPSWSQRDRFVMSKNHGSVITYPILADLGFFPREQLTQFLKDGSFLGIHTKPSVPGADFSGGSLGIGLGMACGMAYVAKLNGEKWLTFCLVGDGECYEGSIWEASMFASANELSNLIVIVDRNQMAITDFTEKMLPFHSLEEKWRSFGWEVRTIKNGHDIVQIKTALTDIRYRQGKPLCLVANTIKGHGIDFMESAPLWHGRAPGGEQAKLAIEQLTGGKLWR